ncbi:MAG: DUF4442 domain-containing protein [Bacteroidota bacterium]
MLNPEKLVEKARTSSFYLWLFNRATERLIPFNKPHGFKISELNENSIRTFLPYKRRNLNHIKGIHACALATLSEFTTGALLLTGLPSNKYRIILQNLEIKYFYQAKKPVKAFFEITPKWVEENIIKPLNENDSTVVKCVIEIQDVDGNHISTANVYWQLKEWAKVKTRV